MKLNNNLVIIIFLSLLFVHSAISGIAKSGDVIRIDEYKVIDRDFYVTCRIADISGEVYGDLAIACQQFTLDGKVSQNLYCAAEKIDIEGEVYGDIIGFAKDIEINGKALGGFRGGCQSLVINGVVDGDVVAGAQWVIIGERAIIEGDVYIGAAELIVEGEVHGDIRGGVGELIVSGLITDDVVIHTDGIELEAGGRIGGNLVYKNDKMIDINNRDQVEGEIIYEYFEEPEFDFFVCGWIWKLILLGMAWTTGIILALVFKKQIRECFEITRHKFGKTLLIGLLGLIVIPVVSVMSIIPIITIPAGLVLFALYLIFMYLGWILVGILIGYFLLQLKLSEPSVVLSALIGIVILMILAMIPFLGGIICFAATILGLGAILYGISRNLWGSA